MRRLSHLTALAFILGTFGQANAWDRDTVDRQVSKLCEQIHPDDWPGQDDCIAVQRRALQSLRPPRHDEEMLTAFDTCRTDASSEYDFSSIQLCFQGKFAVISKERAATAEIVAETKLASEFPTLAVIVNCSFSDGRKIEIRRGTKPFDVIVAKIGSDLLFAGKSGIGYSYEWGGPQGTDYKLDGNQLMDRSGGPVKLYMGQCQYH